MIVEGEYETAVTAIAQDIMEESRALPFDEAETEGALPVNIPFDFSLLGTDSGESTTDRSEFDDFDDYDDWNGTVTTIHGDFEVSVNITYINSTTQAPTVSKSTIKRMDITISSNTLREQDQETIKTYNYSYIRSYYAN